MKKAKICFWCLIALLSCTLLFSQWSRRIDPLSLSKQVTSLKGSWVQHNNTYTTQLPTNLKEGESLELIGLTKAFTIEIEGQTIYRSAGTNAATAVIWIHLPHKAAGKTLSIVSQENLLKLLNNTAYLGTIASLQYRLFKNNFYALLFFVFSLIVSFAIFYVYYHAWRRNSETNGLDAALNLAGFMLCSGIWILSDSQLLQFVTSRSGSVAMISCIAFLTMPLLFLCFAGTFLPHQKSLKIMETIFAVSLLAALVLQLTGLFSIYRYMLIEHILIMIMMIIVTVAFSRKLNAHLRKIRLGCILYFLCYITGLILYYINPYTRLYATTICFGVLLLSLTCIASWYDQYLDEFEAITQNKMLEKMAYIDALTGLGNRAALERDYSHLTEDLMTFVMFDINGLKQANDTYGHHAGDLLIKRAGELILQAFQGVGDAYRIGGDEFVVILKNVSDEATKTYLSKFDKLTSHQTIEHDIPISIAYGAASTSQKGMRLEELYHLADSRMYKRKQEQKKAAS